MVKITCNWCGNDNGEAGKLCPGCGLAPEGAVLSNVHQIRKYARLQGFAPSDRTVKNAIKVQILAPRAGGGYTARAVQNWLLNDPKIKRLPNADPGKDKPALKPEEDSGAALDRIQADAKLKAIHARRAQFDFDIKQGEYTKTATIERDMSARAKVFRQGLERWGREHQVQVAGVFGGDQASAAELCETLGVGKEMIPVVIDWVHEQGMRFTKLWQRAVEDLLDNYSTGRWFDDEMREQWEKYQAKVKAENE